MKILLIDDDEESRQVLRTLLEEQELTNVVETENLQTAIEALDVHHEKLTLIVCNYRGQSSALLKLFLQVSFAVPCILFTDPETNTSDIFLVQREATLETIDRSEPEAFVAILEQFKTDGLFASKTTPDDDYVSVDLKKTSIFGPLNADIYLRLAPGRFCKRFKKEDQISTEELNQYFSLKNLDHFYVRKDELDFLISNQNQELEALVADANASEEKARQAASENLEVVHDLVSQVGFTPQLQELSRKTVALMLKAVGSSPKLSAILNRLRVHEGKYITSHSIMLAEMSCAVAHRIGWNSSATFLKLTLAAFLHDLSLNNNRLAQVRNLSDVNADAGYTASDVQTLKLHPIKSAEYARQFETMPMDVDNIIVQHHEAPDGSGFPRGLYHHQIGSLAAISIVAHDLLDFFLSHAPTNNRADMIDLFLLEQESRYSEGNFRKIAESLKTGEPFVI